jgi:UDP-glucuronate 4-epimerase
MKALVTGAAGAVGSHMAEALLRAGYSVHAVDSLTSYYDPALKQLNASDVQAAGATFTYADLCTANLGPLVADADVIYHFAAQPGISAHVPFRDYVENNLHATYRLLEAVHASGKRPLFVHISTSSVYGSHASSNETAEPKPTSVYGVTKLAAEQLALSYHRDKGLPVTVLRLFSVYGERERPEKLYHKFIKSVMEGAPFTLHEGSEHHVRSYTYVDDIINGCLLALAHADRVPGHIFNIGTDRTITTGEGLRIVETILGRQANITVVPKRPGDQLETAANIRKARSVLGYNPIIRPEEGLARQVAWYLQKVHGKV